MTINKLKEPTKEPVNEQLKTLSLRFNILKNLYSEPKIYRYKELINGKKQISINKQWHVYYYYRNPKNGKMVKFTERKGINRLKTIASRNLASKNLQKALKRYLQDGFNPFAEKEIKVDVNTKIYTSSEALNLAFNQKEPTWKESTIDVNKVYLNSFTRWLSANNLKDSPISEITRKHISFYLSYLIEVKSISNTSRNNHKRLLSSLFTQLEESEIIPLNFIGKISFLKSTAKKNKPFNATQLDEILKYTKENDPYLYDYIKFMWYSFLRPIEIIRLKIENIDFDNNSIEIQTKTKERDYVRLVSANKKYLKTLNLDALDKTKSIFTKYQKPDFWETKKEKSKENWFTRRFKIIKTKFNLSEDYGIYSFRHTSALSLYYHFLNKQGFNEYQSVLKVQEIMRHTDENTTRKYLREIGGQLPKDWSKNYDYELI
ncbi:tyrosine-type recombinase/integrase [Tenacibaculum piscium]|uniref:tyrosine-type recombinase/integrase n=1 Tax=Tenacibaculum piscium TaxID=1458515 RepID=UPI001F294305|nr:site-specific integrase [Tenacibaculum piscium]